MFPNQPQRDPSTIRRVIVWTLTGIIIVPVLYGAICFYPYAREQRFARQILADGGAVGFDSQGPSWIPQDVCERLHVWDRISAIYLPKQKTEFTKSQMEEIKRLKNLTVMSFNEIPITDHDLEEIKGLTKLLRLSLHKTKITDAGLQHLKGFTSLRSLSLTETEVTDDGLEQLQGMTSLKYLDLTGTRTTKENRAKLAKVLPNCVMSPDRIPPPQAKLFPPEPSNRDNRPKAHPEGSTQCRSATY